MKNYSVEIRAVVRKVIPVEANSAKEAEEKGHELFNTMCDEYEEEYDQDTIRCLEVKECNENTD